MRDKARAEPPADHFDRIALRQIIEDLTTRQRILTSRIVTAAGAEPKGAPSKWIDKVVEKWAMSAEDAIALYEESTAALDLSGPVSVGKFALFTRRLDELAADTAR